MFGWGGANFDNQPPHPKPHVTRTSCPEWRTDVPRPPCGSGYEDTYFCRGGRQRLVLPRRSCCGLDLVTLTVNRVRTTSRRPGTLPLPIGNSGRKFLRPCKQKALSQILTRLSTENTWAVIRSCFRHGSLLRQQRHILVFFRAFDRTCPSTLASQDTAKQHQQMMTNNKL